MAFGSALAAASVAVKDGVVAARAGASAFGVVRGIGPGGLAIRSGVYSNGAGDTVGTGV